MELILLSSPHDTRASSLNFASCLFKFFCRNDINLINRSVLTNDKKVMNFSCLRSSSLISIVAWRISVCFLVSPTHYSFLFLYKRECYKLNYNFFIKMFWKNRESNEKHVCGGKQIGNKHLDWRRRKWKLEMPECELEAVS